MPATKRARTESTVTTITKIPKSSARATKTSAKYKVPMSIGGFKNASRIGFPKTMAMVHRYCSTVSATAVAGSTIRYLFSANGMFDPDITGTGHQPQFFDTLSGIYNHYTVTASKLKVRYSTPTTSTTSNIVGVALEDDTTLMTDTDAYMEQPDSVTTQLFVGAAPPVLTKYFSAKKWFGGDPISDPVLQGTSAANPTEQTYFCLFARNVDASSATNTIYFTVEIEYTAVWDELRQLPIN